MVQNAHLAPKVAHNFSTVLSDPHQRAIYDCLGKRGLEEKGWHVVKRTKTPREIRDEYEQLARWVDVIKLKLSS